MKRAQVIGLSVALGAAGLAFVIMKGFVVKPEPPKKVEVQVNTAEVLVARTDIGLGQVAGEGQFRWQTWPKDAVSPGFITQASGGMKAMRELSGAIARVPMMPGEPITYQKLIKAGQGGVLSAILPAGMRAIAVRIKEETAVGRLVLPNDHIDVILIRRLRSKAGEEHVSDTLFRNVRVLAVGQQIETKEGKKTAEGSANTVTLELTPRQAEVLSRASSMGEISLSLRSIADLATDGNGPSSGDEIKQQRGNAIRVLRYGVRSQQYGVN